MNDKPSLGYRFTVQEPTDDKPTLGYKEFTKSHRVTTPSWATVCKVTQGDNPILGYRDPTDDKPILGYKEPTKSDRTTTALWATK